MGKKFWTLLLLCQIAFATPGMASKDPVVATAAGKVSGVRLRDVLVWKGIPFAAPPVGEFRWRPPQAALPWQGVRATHDFAPACPQIAEAPTQLSPLGRTSEDCLYLNIWKPTSPQFRKARLPVMIWLHGGGFIAGSGSEAQFDGAALARQGVVVVTVNYRLGRLGSFAHPALASGHPDEPKGNFGLMDQLAALRWVRSNIGRFGGNASQVTLLGESAGAISAVALATSPAAQGLFHRMIVQSAPLGLPMRNLGVDKPGIPSAMTLGRRWAASKGIMGEDATAARTLRALPLEQVAPSATSPAEVYAIMASSGLSIDGKILLRSLDEALAAGLLQRMPIIVGSNGLESQVWAFSNGKASLIPIFPASEQQILSPIKSDTKRKHVLDSYLLAADGNKVRALDMLRSDAFAGWSARSLADRQSAASPTWLYRFDAVPSQARGVATAAPHGTDVFYMFGSLNRFPVPAAAADPADRKVSQAMLCYWASFARTANPNASARGKACTAKPPAWEAFRAESPSMLYFGNQGIRMMAAPPLPLLDATGD